MKKIIKYSSIAVMLFAAVLALGGCKKGGCDDIQIDPGPEAQEQLQNALDVIEEGCKIELGDGVFEFTNRLTMGSKNEVSIEGRSRESTILSFAGQVSGGEGLYITDSENIVVKNLTIRDTPGDALKIINSSSIVMYRVGAEWSGDPATENGSYGLYPVLSSNILIEECYTYGASDSGIYVGQSDNAIVRNSTATGNVAGIEIENTTNADVVGNTVSGNAAGILVFDLPGLSQSGARTRVFDNTITDNLIGNFAPGGSIVAETPAGTGILVLSTSEVEIFNNVLEQNNVVGTAVASYMALVELELVPPPDDPNYNPFPGSVYIHDNSYSRSNDYPPMEEQSTFGLLLLNIFGSQSIPDIILDGIFTPGSGESGGICIENNGSASFVNLNLPDDFPNSMLFDSTPHACSMESLPELNLTLPEYL